MPDRTEVLEMDVLTDVLNTVRVSAACQGRLELAAPWGVSVPAGEHSKFHVVIAGKALLELDGSGEPIVLSEGDLIALPHGDGHVIRDAPSSPVRPLDELFHDGGQAPCGGQVSVAGSGPATSLVCGRLKFEDPRNHPVLSVLPRVVHLPAAEGRSIPWLESTLRFIACESASGRPGGDTVVNRLADILFIQIVRGYLTSTPHDSRGWLRALTDPQIGASLGLIHAEPEQGWTVATLASKVGMSRSTFAGRFSELVGEPPLHYITRWRMQKAAALLREGRATLADIADRVGYDSEAAFSKAFKRWVGSAPGAYRRASREGVIVASA
ncbi:MAG: AraC family transcriptional regulator [Polyangiaceae bacterium]